MYDEKHVSGKSVGSGYNGAEKAGVAAVGAGLCNPAIPTDRPEVSEGILTTVHANFKALGCTVVVSHS